MGRCAARRPDRSRRKARHQGSPPIITARIGVLGPIFGRDGRDLRCSKYRFRTVGLLGGAPVLHRRIAITLDTHDLLETGLSD